MSRLVMRELEVMVSVKSVENISIHTTNTINQGYDFNFSIFFFSNKQINREFTEERG